MRVRIKYNSEVHEHKLKHMPAVMYARHSIYSYMAKSTLSILVIRLSLCAV